MIVLTALFLAIAIPRAMFPELDHADDYSDADILISGQNFEKFGFIKTHFLTMTDVQLGAPGAFYTHYPMLSSVVNGLLRIVFRTESLYFFRGVALLFAYLNLLFWYLFVRRLTRSDLAGFFSGVFYLANPLFVFSADSLHQLSYLDFLRSLIMYLFLVYIMEGSKKRKWIFLFLFIVIVVQTLMGWEYAAYISLFFILFGFFFKIPKGSLTVWAVIILVGANAVGFLLHFLQNVWHFGSFQIAWQGLTSIAAERFSNSKDMPMALNLANWWKFVIARYFSLVFMLNSFMSGVTAFIAYLLYRELPYRHKRNARRLLRLGALLSLCGVTWYVLLPSHSLAHTFVLFLARHLVPVASLAFAAFFYIWLRYIDEKGKHKLLGKSALSVALIGILFFGVIQGGLPITQIQRSGCADFLIFKKDLLSIKAESSPGDVIGVNYFRAPFMRYYAQRKCVVVMNKEAFDKL